MSEPVTSDKRFELTRRLTPILMLFFLVLMIVMGRVFYFQFFLGEDLKRQSQVNRITHEILPSRRGIITDRNDIVLAADEPVFDLVYTGPTSKIDKTSIERLTRGLNVSRHQLIQRIKNNSNRSVINDLSDSQRIWFAESSRHFTNFRISNRHRRVYRYGDTMAPVIGYTGEIDPAELGERRHEGLSQGKIVGKAGIEKVYDNRLQGRDGIRWIETTAHGDLVRVLNSPKPISPASGDSISLHVDVRLQKAVAKSFPDSSRGAAIVLEIPNGKIRALYSQPAYDPNLIISNKTNYINDLLKNDNDPLLNRVIQSRFTPGSTFKILPFLTAIMDPRFSGLESYECDGEYRLGDHTFGCWEEEGHGVLDLERGLIHSCNVYFYQLVHKGIDYESIVELARSLKFNQKTQVDLPGEKKSQLSTRSLKENKYQSSWTVGDELNGVIGQGYTLISPIKQAQILGTIIAGKQVRPKVAGHAGKSSNVSKSSKIHAEARDKLLHTMDKVTDRGTGYRAQHKENGERIGVDLLGKTGTVQKVKSENEADTPESDAWFISAAPSENPRYVMVVFRQNAGSGGRVAAPQARSIYQSMLLLDFFKKSSKREEL